jgi:hypothetical protein
MPPEAIRTALQLRPFEPFRIHVTDGRTFDVRHPEMVMVTARTAVIGIYDPPGSTAAIPDRTETVALIHVVSLEPLRQTA